MNPRSMIVIVLALICGTSAAWGVSRLRNRQVVYRQPEKAMVLVAKVAMARGQTVTSEMVALREWPADLLPPGALSAANEAVDRAVLAPILSGEPILDGKLASRDSGRGLAALVPSGMRAYTIQTSRIASNVAGFILPSNRVDVLLTLRGGSNDVTGGGSSTTLLQAVEVLAVDQRLDAPAENRVDPKQLSSVTLLVTPDQAALLDLGQNMGVLTLSLRNPEDLTEAETQPATLDILRFTQREPNDIRTSDRGQHWLSRSLTAMATAALAGYAHGDVAAQGSDGDCPAARGSYLEIRTLRGRRAGRTLLVVPRS
jgi:pilus assembly protein CpaB